MEPLESKLDDISIAQADRSLQTGDSNAHQVLNANHQNPTAAWYDGHGAPLARSRPHPIAEGFCKTGIGPHERSYGNRDDTAPTSLIDLSLLDSKDERSKYQAYCSVGLNNLLDSGWRVCYTDGGREGEVAAGVFSEARKGNPSRTYGGT